MYMTSAPERDVDFCGSYRSVSISRTMVTVFWAKAGPAASTAAATAPHANKRFLMTRLLLPQLRIEGVAQRVTQHVEGQHQQEDQRARQGRDVRRDLQELAAVGGHAAE